MPPIPRPSSRILPGGPILALAVAAVTSCNLSTAPRLPEGAERFDPPARYQLWWNLVQECSGRSGSLESVNWYQVPGAFYLPDEYGTTGTWYRHNNTIVLAGRSVLSGDVVRHEMLHALIQGPGHPSDDFQVKCGGVVSCSSQCVDDGGPAPSVATGAPYVNIGDLHLTTEVVPPTHSPPSDSGVIAIRVRARNPFGYAVRLPERAHNFSVLIQPADGGQRLRRTVGGAFARGFHAGAELFHVFDYVLDPGTYIITGSVTSVPATAVEHRIE